MELHYKCTMWCKLIFSDETNKKDLIQKLNEGYLPSEIGFDDDINSEWMIIDDTEEYITPSENDGQPTIEVYQNVKDIESWQECIWDNVNKDKQ